ncbi:MAG: aquaporin [Candidatus Acidiferrum sp.]
MATGSALVALILTFSPISGGHLYPAVTLADAVEHGIPWREVPAYIVTKCIGAIVEAGLANHFRRRLSRVPPIGG